MESASCTHISGLLHALSPPVMDNVCGSGSVSTSQDLFQSLLSHASGMYHASERKVLQKFQTSHFRSMYMAISAHTLRPLSDFDPRPIEHRGTAPASLQNFLATVKGKGLGVSLLLDKDTRVWTETNEEGASVHSSESPSLPSRDDLKERVPAFKECLHVTPEKIRQIERETKDQSRSAFWYSVRRYRITASVFGKVYKRLPSTPPDSLVKELLHPQQFSTKAMEWGRQHEPVALKAYVEHQLSVGLAGLLAVNVGFVVCEKHPCIAGCICKRSHFSRSVWPR